MFELGQPLHAFDMDTLGADEHDGRVAITVRTRPRRGAAHDARRRRARRWPLTTLLICDPTGPVALAGVMGGETTEVSDATVNILLESACFDPASISRTSRSLGLISEASLRFERTVDRTAASLRSTGPRRSWPSSPAATSRPGSSTSTRCQLEPRALTLRIERLAPDPRRRHPCERGRASMLERLGLRGERHADALEVVVPSFRPDLEREIDLIEEVLRIWGMERVEVDACLAGRGRVGGLTREQRWRDRIGATLRAAGLNETMTYAFADPTRSRASATCRLAEGELLVELLNPMSGEQAVLRRSLLPGLAAQRLVQPAPRRGRRAPLRDRLGVSGPPRAASSPRSARCVAGVLAGAWQPPAWNEPAEPLGFFDGKGVLEVLARELGHRAVQGARRREAVAAARARAEVLVGGDVVGWLGEVHPRVLERFEVDAPVTAFELDLAPARAQRARAARAFVEPRAVPGRRARHRGRRRRGRDGRAGRAGDRAPREASCSRACGCSTCTAARASTRARSPWRSRCTYRASDRTLTADEVRGGAREARAQGARGGWRRAARVGEL